MSKVILQHHEYVKRIKSLLIYKLKRLRANWKREVELHATFTIIHASVIIHAYAHESWLILPYFEGTTLDVNKLMEGCEYKFRVSAENKYGQSEPLVSKAITPSPKFGVPSEPEKIEPLDADFSFIEIGWEKPLKDGGSKINGYVVEQKEHPGGRWEKLTKHQLAFERRFKSKHVESRKSYLFRVRAVNSAGEGEPNVSQKPITAKPLRGREIPTLVWFNVFLFILLYSVFFCIENPSRVLFCPHQPLPSKFFQENFQKELQNGLIKNKFFSITGG